MHSIAHVYSLGFPVSAGGIMSILLMQPKRIARGLWEALPDRILSSRLMHGAGAMIYRYHTRHTVRLQSHYTQFMRNPPLLAVLGNLVSRYPYKGRLRLASIGCSTGAELYSVLYVLRTARPDLQIDAIGVDISEQVVGIARRGAYRPGVPAAEDGLYQAGRPEVTDDEVSSLGGIFESDADGTVRVRDWLRENINWFAADATDSRLIEMTGEQNIVIANNFMGPMEDPLAEACLRNVMKLVAPGGYLVVDGIDLDVKTRVLKTPGYKPVTDRLADIWTAETAKGGWPWYRWSREPLDRNRRDWQCRYATIFRSTHQVNG